MWLKVLLMSLFGAVLITGVWSLNQNQAKSSQNTTQLPQQSIKPSSSPLITALPASKVTSKPTFLPISSITPQLMVDTNISGDTTVEISEEVLNNQIKSSLIGQSLGTTPLGDATITNVKLTIHQGYILIAGTAKNDFLNPSFQTKATLTLVSNRPKLNLSDLTLNNIPLPQIITDQLTTLIRSKVDDIILSYNFKLKSLSLKSGKIILVGEK